MTHPYYDLISYEKDDLQDYLKRVLLFDIFKGVFEEYPDIAKKVIRFILYAYSMDSEMLSPNGNNWSIVSEQIMEAVGLPKEVYSGDWMRNPVVLNTIQKWLHWQGNEAWTNFTTYRDLRKEMLASSLSNIKTAGDEINYEQKMKNAIEHTDVFIRCNDRYFFSL